MAHFMPPPLLALFAPRPPLQHKPPIVKRKLPPYSGVSQFVQYFNDPKHSEPLVRNETPLEKKERRRKQKEKQSAAKVQRLSKKWDPQKDSNIKSDAYKTLFIARLAFSITVEDLKYEFEHYGPVKSVRIVKDKDGKSRGYAFVEFKSGSDLKEAYRKSDGRKLDDKRILVDVERGRTVKDWKPRKLGGGLGGTRRGGPDVNVKYSNREGIRSRRSRSRDVGGGGGDRRRHRSRSRDRGGDRHGSRHERSRDRGGPRRDDRMRRSSGYDRSGGGHDRGGGGGGGYDRNGGGGHDRGRRH